MKTYKVKIKQLYDCGEHPAITIIANRGDIKKSHLLTITKAEEDITCDCKERLYVVIRNITTRRNYQNDTMRVCNKEILFITNNINNKYK